MAVKYFCRHCQTSLGQIEGNQFCETRLGFHSLTLEERRDIISYDLNGDVKVSMVCDYCQEALNHHPELLLVANPLQ